MPPLPDLMPFTSPSMVPVIHRPPSWSPGKGNKSNASVRHPPRRQYDDVPLPIKPDATAPKNARIVGRQQKHDGGLVSYRLKIGDVEVTDVSVDEILDYVSALELEKFEILKFREEAEILKVLEQDREVERKEKLARAAESATMAGVVFQDDDSDAEALAALARSDDRAELRLGKNGRAIPDYSKFYKKPRGKGKEILGDFDEEMADDSMPTNEEEQSAPRPVTARSSGPLQQLPKQRRRRRDPATGELMPLAPLPQPKLGIEKKVRQRRRRHPATGELMPIGWKYDAEAESNAYEMRRVGYGLSIKEPSFKRLSISEQHDAKRQRLDTDSAKSSSASPIPTTAEIVGQSFSQHQRTPTGALKASVVDLMSSDDEQKAAVATPSSKLTSRPKQAGNSMMRGTLRSTATTSADESSPEPVATTSVTRPDATSPSASQRTPTASQPKTSILSPSAARESSTDPLAVRSEDESDDDGEWFIESILAHRMSDPSTHPPELGKEPVMLYSVKWVGYEKPTWEPVESFGDRSFVDEYRREMGLKPLPPVDDDDMEEEMAAPRKSSSGTSAAPVTVDFATDEGGQDDEVEYEVERITAHHLSDPRTHPPQLGKTPVILFQVKWKGFEELTWEPEGSFDPDVNVLRMYKRRHGLR